MPNFTDSRPDLRTLLGLIDVIRGVIKLLEKRRSAINWEQYKLRLLRKEITLRLYNSNIELGEVLDKLRSLCGSLDEKATSERNAWQAVREAKSGVVQDCEAALCQRVLSKVPPLRNEMVEIQAQIRMAQELRFEFTGRLADQREAKDLMYWEVFDPAKKGWVEPEGVQARHQPAEN